MIGAPDRPVRTLFAIDELDLGGTEQQILELVRRLDRRRYAPLVVCFRPGRVSREIEDAGVPVTALRKRATVDPGLVLRLRNLMRRQRIELVQTYLIGANTWARMAAVLAGVPVIVSSERNVDMWENAYKPAVARFLDRWTRATVANSEAVKAYLVRKGLPAGKVRVIYNGVDLARFDLLATPETTKQDLGIPPHHAMVLLLTRLEPPKAPEVFLKAASRLAPHWPAVSFVVVGGGSLEQPLAHQARALGLEGRVVFTGPRRDVARILAACDVSVLCSLKEGMSNTVMESMAVGKPVVATPVGGNPELIEDGQSGYLIPVNDDAAVARRLEDLLGDPALAKTMGMRARTRIAELCSVDAMVRSTERLYDELLAEAGVRALEMR